MSRVDPENSNRPDFDVIDDGVDGFNQDVETMDQGDESPWAYEEIVSFEDAPVVQPTLAPSERALRNLAGGVSIIAWFTMFGTFYSLTASVVSQIDTNYDMDGLVRLVICTSVAAVLASLVYAAVKNA